MPFEPRTFSSSPAEQLVHQPASSEMDAGTAKMVQQGGVKAPASFQRVVAHGEAGGVELSRRWESFFAGCVGAALTGEEWLSCADPAPCRARRARIAGSDRPL